jgi:hypothetical protein
MEVTWPNILRIISNLDGKLGSRISALEDVLYAETSGIADLRQPRAKADESKQGRGTDPDVVSTENDSLVCPTHSRDGRLEARVSAMHRGMSEMERAITQLQQQLAADQNRSDGRDWDSQAISESLTDLFFSVDRETKTREKQMDIIAQRLSDECRQRVELQSQVNELTYHVDTGLPSQLPDAIAATEILTRGLERLAGRVGRLEIDKRGSRMTDIQVGEVLQQVAALEHKVHAVHKIYEEDGPAITHQNNIVSRKLTERIGVLECKTNEVTRVMRLLARQTCIVSANAANGRAQTLVQDATAELLEMIKDFEVKGFDELRNITQFNRSQWANSGRGLHVSREFG